MTGGVEGRVCVVSGAARGLGAEIARTFAANGAHLALLDIREDELAALPFDSVTKQEAVIAYPAAAKV